MPTVRKLAPDEVRTVENKGKGTRKLIEAEYDEMLSEFAAGDYGEVDLGSDDKRTTVRSRLKAAAQRRHLSLNLMRTKGDVIRFRLSAGGDGDGQAEVVEPEPDPVVEPEMVPVSSEAPPKRRGGRPKKQPA